MARRNCSGRAILTVRRTRRWSPVGRTGSHVKLRDGDPENPDDDLTATVRANTAEWKIDCNVLHHSGGGPSANLNTDSNADADDLHRATDQANSNTKSRWAAIRHENTIPDGYASIDAEAARLESTVLVTDVDGVRDELFEIALFGPLSNVFGQPHLLVLHIIEEIMFDWCNLLPETDLG